MLNLGGSYGVAKGVILFSLVWGSIEEQEQESDKLSFTFISLSIPWRRDCKGPGLCFQSV